MTLVSCGGGVPGPGLQRLGVEPGLVSDTPRTVTKVKLSRNTRNAIGSAAGSTFEVEVPPGSRYLLFSVAVRGAQQTPGGHHFVVTAQSGGSWRSIYSEVVRQDENEPRWTDRIVDLGDVAPDATRLRFQSVAPTAVPPSVSEAFWGSVMLAPTDGPGESRFWPRSRGSRPSVILISLDTLGAVHLIEHWNDSSVSPFLRGLLERSFSFSHAYAHFPNTLVSHASVFSGQYPKTHGTYRFKLDFDTLAAVLARNGYLTAGVTENGFVSSDFGFDRGFDFYSNGTPPRKGHLLGDAKLTFDKAARWLDTYAQVSPFFLFVHTYEVHSPHFKRDAESARVVDRLDPDYEGPFRPELYDPKEFTRLLENSQIQHNKGQKRLSDRDLAYIRALYAGEMNYLDRMLSDFVHYIEGLDLAERPILVVLSDHGEEFGEHGASTHGFTLYNAALQVPLAFLWPGRSTAGASDVPVQLVDVMPTILDLLEVPLPPGMDGHSLAPVVLGEIEDPPMRPVFAELLAYGKECEGLEPLDPCPGNRLSVQTERFKLIASQEPREEQLYDLSSDPGETTNVADEFGAELERHRALLEEYVANAPRRQAGETAPAVEVDEETERQLEALGYLE